MTVGGGSSGRAQPVRLDRCPILTVLAAFVGGALVARPPLKVPSA